MKAAIGDKVWFRGERRPYTVKACDERFIICTKPFNLKNTVIYTIVDLQKGIRGTEDLIFCMGFETDEQCAEALKRLQSGESEISHRNRVELWIYKISQQ
jgi:hypothetical protein